MEKITIRDIAKISGFSKSTVSKVIRNEPYVKKSTKEKILSIIRSTRYQADEIARSLVLKKTIDVIGLIVSDITNPFFAEVALGIEAEAKKRNCNIILCNTNYIEDEERKYIDILIKNRVLGMILATPKIDDKYIKSLVDIKYPCVLIARKVNNVRANRVSVNYYESMKEGTNYLIKKGHKKIVHLTSDKKIFGFASRLEGYKAALKQNNLKVINNYILKSEASIKGGYEIAKEVLKLEERPTAICAADDLIAIGAMDFLFHNGYKIPDDFSIMGYDNIAMSSLKAINLTTINQPKFEIGKKAIEILFQQINGGSNFKVIEYLFPTKIIERGSVLDLNI